MASTQLQTVQDCINWLSDWSGEPTPSAARLRQIKRAIENAYNTVASAHEWSFFFRRRRLATVADYSTGTIAYTHSTRSVTLSSGTWPSWAAFGVLQIDDDEYEIESRTSDSVIVLSVNSNPGDDIAAGETYTLWRDSYPLPVDFQAMGSLREITNALLLSRIEPNAYVAGRVNHVIPQQPRCYALMEDANYVGTLALHFMPPPDDVRTYEYMYKRKPRRASVWQYTTGTIAASGTTVTGTNTVFHAGMVGCVIRTGTTSALPTGTVGDNPYQEQRIITGYSSATSLTIDAAFDGTVSGTKYEISDPVDMDAGVLYTAFLRRAEYELGTLVSRPDANKLLSVAQEALIRAKEMDQRDFGGERPRGWPLVPPYIELTQSTT